MNAVEMAAIPLGVFTIIVIILLKFCFRKKDGVYNNPSGCRMMGLILAIISLVPMVMFVSCIIYIIASLFE